ncbi:Ig-like domain-containing protein [Vibrio mediterranei]|nr:Ig-like domain-containing protein [Vibrio mediterranei]
MAGALSELSARLALIGMHPRVLIMNENRTEHCLTAAMVLLSLAHTLAEEDYQSKGDESSELTLQLLMALRGIHDDYQVEMNRRSKGEPDESPDDAPSMGSELSLSDVTPGIVTEGFKLALGQSIDIAGNIANPHQQQVSIKSDDEAVLTVEGTMLTAVAPGKTDITVALYKKGDHPNITTPLPVEVYASDETEEK